MSQVVPQWAEIPEFNTLMTKIIDKYPDRFHKVQPEWFVAYGCTNKERPEKSKKPIFDMEGETEPKSFTNTKKYFITMFQQDWDGRSEESRIAIVFAALSRLDLDEPENGKVLSYNYKDIDVMVRTLGTDWHLRGNLPNLLTDKVRIIDEPETDLEE